MALAQSQSNGNKETYLKLEEWRLLAEIPCKAGTVFNKLAALGEVVEIRNIRSECWLELANNWEGL